VGSAGDRQVREILEELEEWLLETTRVQEMLGRLLVLPPVWLAVY